MRAQRRIKGVKHTRFAGKNRTGSEQCADNHEREGQPRDLHIEGAPEVEPNDCITESDGKEGREHNRVYDTVQR